MSGGPLDDARLASIEACLDSGRLDEAQRKLIGLGQAGELGPALTYLTTRLLFLRGRLDHAAVRERMEEVLEELGDFPEAHALLTATSPPPPRPSAATAGAALAEASRAPVGFVLKTPAVPRPLGPTSPPLTDLAPPLTDLAPPLTLDPPRSELPTEPAPPPGPETMPPPLELEPLSTPPTSAGLWHELEADLAVGKSAAALAALEQRARVKLDGLLERRAPEPSRVALESAAFLSLAPAACHFAPFDLSLKSLERVDALLALVAPAAAEVPCYALSILLACYAGECVRLSRGGTWQGRIAEPTTLAITQADERYLPLAEVERALEHGHSLRDGAGPPAHPAAELPEPCSEQPVEPTTPWDPEPWPPIARMNELARALPGSALGTWAKRSLKIPLDRTLESVDAIERYLALIRGRHSPNAKAERRAVALTGAYVGELICLHAAGRWNENDAAPEGPLRFEVLLPDGSASYPLLLTHDALRGAGQETLRHRVGAALGK